MKKKNKPKLLLELQNAITEHHNKIKIPSLNKNLFSYSTNISNQIDCKISLCPNIINPNNELLINNLKVPKDSLYKSIKYNLLPNQEQKQLMLGFCDAYIDMYNVFVKHIKNLRKDRALVNNNINYRYCDLEYIPKINLLKKLFANDKKYLTKKYKINAHILDAALVDALAMYKSIISNQLNGHIKFASFRYLKKSKQNKIFKVEKYICQENSFCSSVIGPELEIYPKLNYVNECKKIYIIQYNKKTDKFILIKRVPLRQENLKLPNQVISIDPGEKTLLTGISENHTVEIGKQVAKKVELKLKKIQQIEERKKQTKSVQNNVKQIEKYIENYITDIQWKISNYLTSNYKTILIGNLSTLRMKKNKKANNLDILKCLNMGRLREKIKYRSMLNNIKYKCVKESYTTKCCINCGKVNEIGLCREYKCECSNKIYDRDIKSAGCIYLKTLK